MILKLLGIESGISSATAVSNNVLIRVINTGVAGVANVAYANGTVYGSITISNAQYVVINKAPTDTIAGTANMLAVPVAFRY